MKVISLRHFRSHAAPIILFLNPSLVKCGNNGCSLLYCSHVCVYAGAILAVQGGVDDNGFYLGSFEGKKGLVPANFVQEMEVEDSQQRKRLLNQTLSRPQLPSLTSPYHTSLSSSRPNSASILSPSGSQPTYSPFLQSTSKSGLFMCICLLLHSVNLCIDIPLSWPQFHHHQILRP